MGRKFDTNDRWVVDIFSPGESIQIYPTNDERGHFKKNCECKPVQKFKRDGENINSYVIHNAFDMREVFE